MAQKHCVILGQKCNCACIMCGIPGLGENLFLSREDLNELMEDWELTGRDVIELCGGEPTIHPEFLDLCRSVTDETPADVWVLSNGIRFSDERFSKALSEIDIAGVVVPLYSHAPEVHDTITGRAGSFRRTVKGLELLQSMDVPIVVKYIPLSLNYLETPEYVSFLRERFPSQSLLFVGLCLDHPGEAHKNVERVAAEYAEIAGPLEAAIDIGAEARMKMGLLYFPICVFHEPYWTNFDLGRGGDDSVAHYWEMLHKVSPEETPDLPPVCGDCSVHGRCHWKWDGYVKHYGTDKIHPVTARPELGAPIGQGR